MRRPAGHRERFVFRLPRWISDLHRRLKEDRARSPKELDSQHITCLKTFGIYALPDEFTVDCNPERLLFDRCGAAADQQGCSGTAQ